MPMRRVHGPRLPEPNSDAAAQMLAKWTMRRPVSGAAFHQLQGHILADSAAAPPQVHLFHVDLPSFKFQSERGMNHGDGRFSSVGVPFYTFELKCSCISLSGYRRRGDLHDLVTCWTITFSLKDINCSSFLSTCVCRGLEVIWHLLDL